MSARRDPLVALLDEARAREQGAARVQERWLHRLAEEEATVVGTLLDLAERGAVVSLRASSGRTSSGTVVAVGGDFVALRTGGSSDVCIRIDAIGSIRPLPGERSGPATGGRGAPLDLLLVEVLAGLASDRPRLAVVTVPDGVVSGQLVAVGGDVLTFRLDGGSGSLCYVPVAAVQEVLLVEG